ncbi:MAG: LrgB family protein [Rubrimonas sp.]|uniref:LrgB family protein n=1 Tax=Rubrimonas sp. TaxID=2036015 RepID=UPI002FDE0AF3
MNDALALVSGQPLFAVGVTVAAYAVADGLWRRSGHSAFLNPVLVATCLVAALLMALGISYPHYLRRTELINETLALLIVLLSVPLCRQFGLIRQAGVPIGVALLTGSVVALGSALAYPGADGGDAVLMATLAPKSATAAVAVEITDRLGGVPGLTAVIVISTGIIGAAFGPPMLDAAGVSDDRAKGFALGVASHAIGTARAFQISETAGAFASLGMIMNALLTILLAPLALAALSKI